MAALIELDSVAKIAEHGNLWNTPNNQLRRKLGRFTVIYREAHAGTVRDSLGKCWDWWLNESGEVVTLEAT